MKTLGFLAVGAVFFFGALSQANHEIPADFTSHIITGDDFTDPTIIPKVKPAYFNVSEFSQCIAAQMMTANGPLEAKKRLLYIQKFRGELFKKYGYTVPADNNNWFDFALKIGRPILGPFQFFHSLPFFDVDRFAQKLWGKGPVIATLRKIYDQAQAQGENLYADSRFYERVENFPAQTIPYDPQAIFRDKAEAIESPLIVWLLKQPMLFSVGHPQVFLKAMELYDGDAFTALGSLGHLFYKEADARWDRGRITYLGSRMIPIVKADQPGDELNPVGQNYHFWTYLNMAMTGGEAVMRFISYSFESVYQSDMVEYSADYWALNSGLQVRRIVLSGVNPGLEHCH